MRRFSEFCFVLAVAASIVGFGAIPICASEDEGQPVARVTTPPDVDPNVPPTRTEVPPRQVARSPLAEAPRLYIPPGPSLPVGTPYIPPPRGTISIRVGAATRGPREDFPTIEALAPDHVALTLEAQPTLWWYLSRQSDTRIDVTLIDDSIDPLIEIVKTPPVRAGFHAVRLAAHGVSLDRETLYRWYIAIVPDPERRSYDVLASAALERIEPSATLRDELDAEAADTAYRVLAGNGIWYDALDSLSGQIGRNPSDVSLRALHTLLLRQVGLTASVQ